MTANMDVSLEREKVEIIRWVTTIRDRDVIKMLKMLREDRRRMDWWDGVSGEEKKVAELRNMGIVD